MGVLDRFEKGIERAVNSAFAKAFRSEVQPVEIASALRKEIDDKAAIVGRDRTIAPNDFVVELGKGDHERLEEWQEALGGELTTAVHQYATQQRYAFVGPVHVTFEEAHDLDTGVFRVRSTTTGAPTATPAADRQAPPAPSAPPLAPSAPVEDRTASASPSAVRPAATLEVDGALHRVTKPVTVIGRGADVDLPVEDPGVSRRHAEVHLVDGRVRVIDLGSTNGTFVDGERIHAATLADGSTITVGRSRITVRLGQW
jgi:Protein of unknown function (DUF3662)/FHA domain